MVGAVDGIEICSSFARCCDACMKREVQHKVNGAIRTDIQYYHRIVVVAVVSTPFPIPLGLRFQKNGEGEVGSIMFRDGTRRAIQARDLASGAVLANIARTAVRTGDEK